MLRAKVRCRVLKLIFGGDGTPYELSLHHLCCIGAAAHIYVFTKNTSNVRYCGFTWFESHDRSICLRLQFSIRDLSYEDGKARTAVVAGNFRGSRRVPKDKMLRCVFS